MAKTPEDLDPSPLGGADEADRGPGTDDVRGIANDEDDEFEDDDLDDLEDEEDSDDL